MSRISHPTSVLLDKGTVREALRGLARVELERPLPQRQSDALEAVFLIRAALPFYATPQLLHLLEHPANARLSAALLPGMRSLAPARYLRRWARRLREDGFSREDALIVSYASFGMDAEAESLGADVVVTTDLALKRRFEEYRPRLEERFHRMVVDLREPYSEAELPRILSPTEIIDLLGSSV